jgi:polynucleotide 5'-kinase involved in rRNA processing
LEIFFRTYKYEDFLHLSLSDCLLRERETQKEEKAKERKRSLRQSVMRRTQNSEESKVVKLGRRATTIGEN